jgi:isoleucyl-tRNA synthetase
VDLQAVLADELNVKSVERVQDTDGFIDYEVKPQLKTLGPKYGKLLNAIRTHLAENGRAVVAATRDKTYTAVLEGQQVELTADDILVGVKSREGFAAESDDGLSVVLDTRLTRELIEEGCVRELISKLQNLRKDAGFAVTDRIRIFYAAEPDFEKVVTANAAKIRAATLAEELLRADGGEQADINGNPVFLRVEKVS